MIHRYRSTRAAFLAILLFCAWSWCCAAPVIKRRIDDVGIGAVNARILASFQAHARPAQEWYQGLLNGRDNPPTHAEFSAFSRQFETATFVSFTYEYKRNGRTIQRVYHARSGHNEPNTGILNLRSPRLYQSYFNRHDSDIVVWDDPRPGVGRVTVSPVAGDRYAQQRKRDAELKVARQLERDILAGVVPSGGDLYGFSSQVPCDSCERALQALSDNRGITVRVAYLGHGSAAYTTFNRERHQHLTSIEVAVNRGQLNLLNQSAASTSAMVPATCADTPADGEIDDE